MAPIYQAIIWSEMKPDLYGGVNHDERIPLWEVATEGCKGDVELDKEVSMLASAFPPGTKITVEVPTCSDCGMEITACDCENKNWDLWIENKYC